jgi:Smg protein
MKHSENILDVLMYLFDNYVDSDNIDDYDHDVLRQQLHKAGFVTTEISKALNWLDDLVDVPQAVESRDREPLQHAIRHYSAEEVEKLSTECQGFLLFLQQLGVLSPAMRERVIDRAMALESEQLTLDELKWVLLMVLFNHPEQAKNPSQLHWLENLIYGENNLTLH